VSWSAGQAPAVGARAHDPCAPPWLWASPIVRRVRAANAVPTRSHDVWIMDPMGLATVYGFSGFQDLTNVRAAALCTASNGGRSCRRRPPPQQHFWARAVARARRSVLAAQPCLTRRARSHQDTVCPTCAPCHACRRGIYTGGQAHLERQPGRPALVRRAPLLSGDQGRCQLSQLPTASSANWRVLCPDQWQLHTTPASLLTVVSPCPSRPPISLVAAEHLHLLQQHAACLRARCAATGRQRHAAVLSVRPAATNEPTAWDDFGWMHAMMLRQPCCVGPRLRSCCLTNVKGQTTALHVCCRAFRFAASGATCSTPTAWLCRARGTRPWPWRSS
jgi:hypothetical protein